jgi:hypothetical protein
MPGCSYNNIYRQKDPRFFPLAEPVSPAPVRFAEGEGRTDGPEKPGKFRLPLVS